MSSTARLVVPSIPLSHMTLVIVELGCLDYEDNFKQ